MLCAVTRDRAPSKGLTRAVLALVVLVLAVTGVGCPCSGLVNVSPGLRWWLFSNFGAIKMCPEMMKSGVPLRLQDRSPAIGRFFVNGCTYNVDDARQVVQVNVSGTGYAYMAPAKRVGFQLTVSAEYRPDFMLAGDDAYVWARLNRIVNGPSFQLDYVENRLVDIAANVPPFGSVANFLGNQVVSSALTRGFTVVHNSDRGDDFTLGILNPPEKPHHPFEVTSDRFTFANETTEVHSNERDYLGPFEVPKNGQALYLAFQLQSAAPLDMFIVDKRTGDAWREGYQTGQPLGPPPGSVYATAQLHPGIPDNRRYPLPAGLFYVVIDNTSAAGVSMPPLPGIFTPILGNDQGALVSYVAQLGP
jgi:hypothetical protein